MTSNNPVRVLLADDHVVVLRGMRQTLEQHGITVVGEAKNFDEAMTLFKAGNVDVAILDIRFGEQRTGLKIAEAMFAMDPKARIIFVSQFDQSYIIKETYQMGALAYLTKDFEENELVEAVHSAMRGETYYVREIGKRLADEAIKKNTLDQREIELWKMMAEGASKQEMADKLGMSTRTIHNFCKAVEDKLQLSRPADITRKAINEGLIDASGKYS